MMKFRLLSGLSGVLLAIWLAVSPAQAGRTRQPAAQATAVPTPTPTAVIPNTGADQNMGNAAAAFGLYLFLGLLVLGITAALLAADDRPQPP